MVLLFYWIFNFSIRVFHFQSLFLGLWFVKRHLLLASSIFLILLSTFSVKFSLHCTVSVFFAMVFFSSFFQFCSFIAEVVLKFSVALGCAFTFKADWML